MNKMEQGLFFPSKNGDRKYKASDFTGYFSKLFSNGVFSNNSKNLQVMASATNGLSLTVEAGYGNINGYLYQLSESKTVVFNIADVSGTAKKGSVVLRMNLTERKMTVEVKGTDELTRNATVYELMLARILIPGNGKPITQGMIQDTRGDGNVCGFVSSLIDIDPTTLWTQFETNWNEWLTEIKGTVGDDAAVNLALEINKLINSSATKTEIKELRESVYTKNEISEIIKNIEKTKFCLKNKNISGHSRSFPKGMVKIALSEDTDVNSEYFSMKGTEFVCQQNGYYEIHIEMSRTDLLEKHNWSLGFTINGIRSESWRKMSNQPYYLPEGPNKTGLPQSHSALLKLNKNDIISFFIDSEDGPRGYEHIFWHIFKI